MGHVCVRLPQAPQTFDGRHEIVGAGHGLSEAGERVARAGDQACHAVEHSGKPLLIGTESNEHGAVVFDASVGHVAAEDVPELVLIGARYMRVSGLFSSSMLSGLVRPMMRSC